MTFKEVVYSECMSMLNNKISSLEQTLLSLRESAANETKSTAGDKHETALAMLQIEQENSNKQLENFLLQRLSLQRIATTTNTNSVANGSLVKTNKGYLFISIALGKIIVQDTVVVALSSQSPLGARLIGLRVNDVAEMNGVKYVIEEID